MTLGSQSESLIDPTKLLNPDGQDLQAVAPSSSPYSPTLQGVQSSSTEPPSTPLAVPFGQRDGLLKPSGQKFPEAHRVQLVARVVLENVPGRQGNGCTVPFVGQEWPRGHIRPAFKNHLRMSICSMREHRDGLTL